MPCSDKCCQVRFGFTPYCRCTGCGANNAAGQCYPYDPDTGERVATCIQEKKTKHYQLKPHRQFCKACHIHGNTHEHYADYLQYATPAMPAPGAGAIDNVNFQPLPPPGLPPGPNQTASSSSQTPIAHPWPAVPLPQLVLPSAPMLQVLPSQQPMQSAQAAALEPPMPLAQAADMSLKEQVVALQAQSRAQQGQINALNLHVLELLQVVRVGNMAELVAQVAEHVQAMNMNNGDDPDRASAASTAAS
jgi:hypothetical protein